MFPFHLEDANSKYLKNHNNKVVAQCFGTRICFIVYTKIDHNPLNVVILCHRMGRVRAARLATNMLLLLSCNTWVYEKTSGTLNNGEVKRLEHFDNTSEDSCSDEDYVKLA